MGDPSIQSGDQPIQPQVSGVSSEQVEETRQQTTVASPTTADSIAQNSNEYHVTTPETNNPSLASPETIESNQFGVTNQIETSEELVASTEELLEELKLSLEDPSLTEAERNSMAEFIGEIEIALSEFNQALEELRKLLELANKEGVETKLIAIDEFYEVAKAAMFKLNESGSIDIALVKAVLSALENTFSPGKHEAQTASQEEANDDLSKTIGNLQTIIKALIDSLDPISTEEQVTLETALSVIAVGQELQQESNFTIEDGHAA